MVDMKFKKREAYRVHMIEIDKLKRAEYNPKRPIKKGTNEYVKLRASILEHGIADPDVVNYDLTLIDGHQRLTVIEDLLKEGFSIRGMDGKKLPCWVVYTDKRREKALNMALDEIRGQRDWRKKRELLIQIDTGEFPIEAAGFTEGEMAQLVTRFGDEYEKAELEFAEDLLLEHNYVILYFDNAFDWEVAKEKFGLKRKKQQIDDRKMSVGIGRVLRGKEWLDRIK